MADHPELHELHRQYTESQSKYVYFLLAAAGASIGFAIQKLEGMPLTWDQSSALLAIALWLGSLFCGCKRITWTQSAMYANFALLQLQYGLHPEQPPHQHLPAAVSGVRSAIAKHSNRANIYYKLQFWLLGAGVLAFVTWSVQEMARLAV
ncbi:MAG: hypothetical protein K0M64_01360 [Rhizobium sp.]|nr:hypothetical protein [Rhizobium sp.]